MEKPDWTAAAKSLNAAFVDLAPVDPAPVDPAPVDAATAKPSARKSSSFVKFAKISGLVLSGLVGVAGVAGGVFALTNAAMAGQVLSQVLSVSVASDALMWGAIGAVALGALAMVGVGIAAGKMAEAARSDSTNFTAAVIALSMLEAMQPQLQQPKPQGQMEVMVLVLIPQPQIQKL